MFAPGVDPKIPLTRQTTFAAGVNTCSMNVFMST